MGRANPKRKKPTSGHLVKEMSIYHAAVDTSSALGMDNIRRQISQGNGKSFADRICWKRNGAMMRRTLSTHGAQEIQLAVKLMLFMVPPRKQIAIGRGLNVRAHLRPLLLARRPVVR